MLSLELKQLLTEIPYRLKQLDCRSLTTAVHACADARAAWITIRQNSGLLAYVGLPSWAVTRRWLPEESLGERVCLRVWIRKCACLEDGFGPILRNRGRVEKRLSFVNGLIREVDLTFLGCCSNPHACPDGSVLWHQQA
jgi:hypothetical protein